MGIFKLNGIDYMGGGGGDSGMELTYDEYLALSEEEKNNGTTYYVKDINGVGKDQFQPIIYSEEEREIGVWTDGKPLYQKTWIYTATSVITSSTVIGNYDANTTEIKAISSQATEGTTDYLLPYVGGGGGYSSITTSNGNILLAVSNASWGNGSIIKVTIQYTKTSDTPGSGTWTPQGVPAVHYDGDEKVVGTWIDGSTLYEKSYHVPTVTSTYIIIDSTISTSTIKIRDVSMGTMVIGGAYNNAQYVDGRLSYTSFIRVILGPGLSVGMEAPPSESVTDFDFTIRYTKTAS